MTEGWRVRLRMGTYTEVLGENGISRPIPTKETRPLRSTRELIMENTGIDLSKVHSALAHSCPPTAHQAADTLRKLGVSITYDHNKVTCDGCKAALVEHALNEDMDTQT